MKSDLQREANVLLPENHLSLIVRIAWRSLLGGSLQRRARRLPPGRTWRHVTSTIRISGAWEGTIYFDFPRPLIRRASAALFNRSADKVPDGLVEDVAKEMVNIIGGQIKALLNGPCRLSLPSLTEPPRDVKDLPGELISHLLFEAEGFPLQVIIIKGP